MRPTRATWKGGEDEREEAEGGGLGYLAVRELVQDVQVGDLMGKVAAQSAQNEDLGVNFAQLRLDELEPSQAFLKVVRVLIAVLVEDGALRERGRRGGTAREASQGVRGSGSAG